MIYFMFGNYKTYLLFFLLFFSIHLHGYEVDSNGIVKPTTPPHLVNDFAGLLTAEQVNILENELVAYNDSTTTQIAVVIIDSLNGMPISDYALQLGRTWGIGQKGKNNGVLLLISKNDREVDIEVGYGLEAHLTDYGCRAIIQNSIVPNFKEGKYFEGIQSATYSIKYFLENYTPASSYSYPSYLPNKSFFEEYGYLVALFILLVIPFILGMIFGWSGGSSTYSSSGWTSNSSSNYSSTSSYSSSSSSSSSGSSFSGFGGGSFGGGGSSGKW
ncbi:MAG: TPM domain-containing protein [Chitinophagales bacterium]